MFKSVKVYLKNACQSCKHAAHLTTAASTLFVLQHMSNHYEQMQFASKRQFNQKPKFESKYKYEQNRNFKIWQNSRECSEWGLYHPINSGAHHQEALPANACLRCSHIGENGFCMSWTVCLVHGFQDMTLGWTPCNLRLSAYNRSAYWACARSCIRRFDVNCPLLLIGEMDDLDLVLSTGDSGSSNRKRNPHKNHTIGATLWTDCANMRNRDGLQNLKIDSNSSKSKTHEGNLGITPRSACSTFFLMICRCVFFLSLACI